MYCKKSCLSLTLHIFNRDNDDNNKFENMSIRFGMWDAASLNSVE